MKILFVLLAALSCHPLVSTAQVFSGQGSPDRSTTAVQQLETWLTDDVSQRGELDEQPFAATPLSQADAERATDLLWNDMASRLKAERQQEMKDRVLSIGDLKMPFDYTVFGQMPEGGRSLFISMHGGGGAPKRVNDQQWENQKRLYSPSEGVYVAPRAPTDTWNLWHQQHIDQFFDRLIENMVLFEDVNPDRVYLMGYSAGGDGVYQLAPRMSDRLAAAAMMAGHPNETSPLGLRNVPFTLHMGAEDSAYNRNAVAAEWKQQLETLRAEDPQGYDHWVEIHPGKGHWMDRQDAEAIPWMTQRARRRFPRRLVWKQDDVTHRRSYWLAVEPANVQPGSLIVASIDGQHIQIDRSDVSAIRVRLNDQMLDLNQPVVVTSPEKTELFRGTVDRTIGMLAATMRERHDPGMVFAGEIVVQVPVAE